MFKLSVNNLFSQVFSINSINRLILMLKFGKTENKKMCYYKYPNSYSAYTLYNYLLFFSESHKKEYNKRNAENRIKEISDFV